jgi:hypothetical protein
MSSPAPPPSLLELPEPPEPSVSVRPSTPLTVPPARMRSRSDSLRSRFDLRAAVRRVALELLGDRVRGGVDGARDARRDAFLARLVGGPLLAPVLRGALRGAVCGLLPELVAREREFLGRHAAGALAVVV